MFLNGAGIAFFPPHILQKESQETYKREYEKVEVGTQTLQHVGWIMSQIEDPLIYPTTLVFDLRVSFKGGRAVFWGEGSESRYDALCYMRYWYQEA